MKKRLIRITESDLRNMVRTSVNRILKEYHGEPDEYTTLVSTSILEGYQAEEIAEEYNLSVDEAAAEWFKGALGYEDFEENTVTSKRKYVTDIPELDAEMYYDIAADYYFLVRKTSGDMIGFNENTIREDASAGATNAAGVMQGGGSNPEAGQYTVPFGGVQRRKIYSPKGDAKGDVTKQESNVDMTPAMKRKNGKGGSISIPKKRR